MLAHWSVPCGVGKFLLEPILHNLNHLYTIETDEHGAERLVPKITLVGYDKGECCFVRSLGVQGRIRSWIVGLLAASLAFAPLGY